MPRPGGERPHIILPPGVDPPERRAPKREDDPYLGFNPDTLPDNPDGSQWVPWERAEAAGMAEPERRTPKTDLLGEIMAEKGIGVVKFGFPAGTGRSHTHYDALPAGDEHGTDYEGKHGWRRWKADQHVARQRQQGVPEDEITHITVGDPGEELQRNIHGILGRRSREDGVRYTVQPGVTRPGQPWLVNKEESARPDNDVPVPVTSREGVRISPRRHTHAAHVPGDETQYEPRIVEGWGTKMRHHREERKEARAERTERAKEKVSELPLIRGGLKRARALRDKKPRRKL